MANLQKYRSWIFALTILIFPSQLAHGLNISNFRVSSNIEDRRGELDEITIKFDKDLREFRAVAKHVKQRSEPFAQPELQDVAMDMVIANASLGDLGEASDVYRLVRGGVGHQEFLSRSSLDVDLCKGSNEGMQKIYSDAAKAANERLVKFRAALDPFSINMDEVRNTLRQKKYKNHAARNMANRLLALVENLKKGYLEILGVLTAVAGNAKSLELAYTNKAASECGSAKDTGSQARQSELANINGFQGLGRALYKPRGSRKK